MPLRVRNRRQPWELSDDDVTAAIARIGERDDDLARDAGHVYDALTWDEGPGQIRRAGVQDWLWYRLPMKHLTDEVGYTGRLAETAAVLFDELGLDAYAAICRARTDGEGPRRVQSIRRRRLHTRRRTRRG